MKEGWKMVKLKNICDKASSNVAQKDLDNNNGEYPIYGASGFIKKVDFFHYDKPYIGIVKDGSGVGRVNIYPANSSLLGTLQYIFPKNGYELGFVYYALQSLNLSKYKVGAAIPHIYFRDYGEKELFVPPLEEQHRIVSILNASFEKIDALKKNAEENLKNAKALFQQVLAQELKPKEGWVEKKLTDISENLDYKRVPITKNVRKSGKFPYYGASGIVDYVNDYLYDEDLLLISEDGANLLARTTPIAFSVSGKIWVNNHAHVLRFNNLTLQKFVEYFIAGFNITPYVTGMAQPKLNQKALEKIIISFPTDIEEQHRIVQTLDTLSEKCRRLEEVAQQTIRECDALKQSILRQAFSGEL